MTSHQELPVRGDQHQIETGELVRREVTILGTLAIQEFKLSFVQSSLGRLADIVGCGTIECIRSGICFVFDD